MSQQTEEYTFSNEEALTAALDEQTLNLNAQIEHLKNRNTFLRAVVNRLTAEAEERRLQDEESASTEG